MEEASQPPGQSDCKEKEMVEVLEKIKDYFKGERIFILGTAPSLNDIPLEKLQDEFTFGIHRIGMIYDSTPWRPDFFICSTKRVGMSEGYKADVQRSIDLGGPCFIGERIKDKIPDSSNIFWIKCMDIIDRETAPPKDEYWDRDVSKGEVCIYGHTGLGAILISIYMGFDPIYLGGMGDYHVLENASVDTNHFNPEYEVKNIAHHPRVVRNYQNNLRMSHEFTARKAAERGLRIFSLDINEGLDMYQQANLEEVLNE